MENEVPVLDSASQAEAQHLAAGYTSTQRLLELSGVTLFFGLTVTTVLDFAYYSAHQGLSALTITACTATSCLVGLLAADFASGFVHWAADNWGHPDWPVLGAGFIRPFRHHHVDPKDITRHPFLELNGNNCIVSLPLFYAANRSLTLGGASGLLLAAFWLFLAIWVLGTNQFHAWAHTDTPPKFARALQRAGLILSTPHHEVHHTRPHNGNYCITTGWLNRPLRVLHFFEFVEVCITKATGVQPNHKRLKPVPE